GIRDRTVTGVQTCALPIYSSSHLRVRSADWRVNGEPESARRQFMPARETEAIILKTFPLGEADRLVSFFGRTSGRIRGVAGGAQIGRASCRERGEGRGCVA